MTTKKRYQTESDGKEYNSLYGAAINGPRVLDVVDRNTNQIVETIIEQGRPADTQKKKKKDTPYEQMFTKLHTRVTDAILNKEIEGYEIIVLMNCISRISLYDYWVVNESGVKMTLRAISESAGLDKNKMNTALENLQCKGFIYILPIDKRSNGIKLAEWIAYKG